MGTMNQSKGIREQPGNVQIWLFKDDHQRTVAERPKTVAMIRCSNLLGLGSTRGTSSHPPHLKPFQNLSSSSPQFSTYSYPQSSKHVLVRQETLRSPFQDSRRRKPRRQRPIRRLSIALRSRQKPLRSKPILSRGRYAQHVGSSWANKFSYTCKGKGRGFEREEHIHCGMLGEYHFNEHVYDDMLTILARSSVTKSSVVKSKTPTLPSLPSTVPAMASLSGE
jgi:hypothetical protein